MNKRTNIKDFARRATMTLLLALVTTTAWAQNNVSYRAYNTSTHQFENGVAASPTAVTAGTTVMSGGWYVVSSNVTVSDRIEVTGTVNLILCDGKTLTATQGLHVPTGVTLNIYGQSGGTGGLTATQGGSDQAGIGGNSGEVSGSITIHGGNVTSTGGWSGAGIGGGHDRPCGSITIYGGTVNAHGGDRAAGIGGGTGEYSGGTITIMGGTVTAWANNLSNVYDNSQAIGVGLSSNPGTCTLFLGDVKVYNRADATTPVASTDRESTCRSKYVRLMPCDHHYVNDECTYCGADEYYAPRQYLAYETASQSFVLRSAYEFTYVMSNITTMGTDGSEKYYVVKNDVSIGSRIEVRGTVHLILCDGKTLTASKGITVNNGNTLNIYGQSGGTGTLNAYGTGSNGGESAAIGSTGHTTVGNITIHGGRINADGASWSAGIGGGVSAGGGSVKIYGGTVDATGHNGTSEAIGRGSSGSSVSKTIADGLRVIVDGNTVAYSQRVSKLNSSDSDIRDTRQAVVEPCTHVGSGNRCQYCNASIYHVTYNNNDATSGTVPTDANYESGQTVTVPGNTGNLERTGYLFIGWNTEADGSGVSYPEGATFVIRDNITLYADWSSILELAGNADNSSTISAAAADGKQHRVVLDGYTLYRDGTWNTLVLPFNLATLDGTPLEGFTVKTLASSANNNGLLTMTFSDATTIEAGKPYIVKREADLVIRTTDDWITFAYNVNNGNDYQGKVVKLAADISVTTMVGAPNNSSTSSLDGAYPFSGTFDGNGHTLTITYSNTEQHTAPFRCVNGATIKNLHVAGSITTSAKFAAGVVGRAFGSTTVTNCRSSVEITSTVSGDGTHAGLVAIVAAYSTDNLTMEGCLFDGKLLGASTSHCGGLVGYRYAGSGAVSISNSLFAPSQVTVSGTSSAVLCRDEGTGSYTNCYYTYQLGTTQGTNASSMSNETLVSYLCDGWEISNSKVVPKMENSIADIVNLVFEDVLISAATANVSTTYADFIGSYAPITDATLLLDSHNPDGDAMHAALKAKREGYTFEGCYSDAALTTPVTTIPFAADGTVTLYIKVSTPLNYTITYNLNGGTNHASNPDTYNIESATITLQAPDKTGYSFGGWFDNEDCTGNAVTSIATGSYGDMTLYAKWLTEELELANNGDNRDAISTAAASGLYHNVTLADRTIYKDGDWNTLCLPFSLASLTGTPLEGLTVKTLESTTFNDGTLTMNFSDDLTSIEAGKPYIVKNDNADLIIRSAADWNTFATNVNNGTDNYQGKLVKLAADISVSTMVGDQSHPFKGTFDGCGHTLTFNYTTDADNAAPFQWIMNAVIKNLKVMGEIRSSQMFAAGFVARAYGDNAIENCVSSVTIHATKVGDGTHGGFVGRIESDCKTFTFTDCKFNGTFDGSNTDNWCPFAAWSMGNDNTHFTFNNCLYAPASANVRGGCATFYRNGTATLNGAYYTQAIGTAQGTNANGMSNETLVGYLGSGWEISNDQVVPKMINSVDNIVNPVFSNVLISDVTANVSTTYADFIGNFSPVTLTGGNKSVLYLGTNNQLYYPAANRTMKACRAYFRLNGLTVGGHASGPDEIKAFVLNFGDEDDPDSLTPNPSLGRGEQDDAWYSLDGKKLSGKPSQKGIYVNNGRKVVLK